MKSISSCPYMEIRKIHSWQHTPQDRSVTVKRRKGHYALFSVLSNILQKVLNKRIVCQTLLITAVIKVSMKPRSGATANHHLHGSGERKGEQRRTKVSFGRTMMRALKLQQLAKRHISGRSDVEQP